MWTESGDVAMEYVLQYDEWSDAVDATDALDVSEPLDVADDSDTVVLDGSVATKVDAATETVESVEVDDRYAEWQDVDRELRSIARRQSGLDAELMRALREAERVRLWKHLGCVSMMEYLERIFGYSPRVAQERLRTARKLEQLPELARALADHELPFSAVRELTRVATPVTERAWRAAARGKCLREIEELVSGLAEGDEPGTRKKPELMRGRISYEEIDTATKALERQARKSLEEERGEHLDDNAFLAAVFELALGALGSDAGTRDRAKFQIVHYRCDGCGSVEQLGGGARIPVDDAHAERAECDAEHVTLDGSGVSSRAIPRKVRRFVDLRDGGRCRIPGCRSSRNLEFHHIEHIEHGGTHDPENIIRTCGGHHQAHHDGQLWISGTSSQLIVRRFDDPVPEEVVTGAQPTPSPTARPLDVPGTQVQPPRTPPSSLQDERRAMIRDALIPLGWKKSAACATADKVLVELGPDAAPEALVRRALQTCRGRARNCGTRPGESHTASPHVPRALDEQDAHVGAGTVTRPCNRSTSEFRPSTTPTWAPGLSLVRVTEPHLNSARARRSVGADAGHPSVYRTLCEVGPSSTPRWAPGLSLVRVTEPHLNSARARCPRGRRRPSSIRVSDAREAGPNTTPTWAPRTAIRAVNRTTSKLDTSTTPAWSPRTAIRVVNRTTSKLATSTTPTWAPEWILHLCIRCSVKAARPRPRGRRGEPFVP